MNVSVEIAKFIESVLGWVGNLVWDLPWRHSVDVALMSFIVYQVYIRIRGTRAMRILAGIVALGLGYLTAQAAGLFLTSWVLGGIWAAALILVIVIFQREIRHMLEQVNPSLPLTTLLGWGSQARFREETLATLAQTAMAFAAKRRGALFVFERNDFVEPLLKSPGTLIDAQLSEELLETIFADPAPLHDGALYVRGGRAYRAGCVLPLSDDPQLSYFYGTRHRAAVGITEQSDAVAVAVSEERGTVSVVEGGTIHLVDNATELLTWLTERLSARGDTGKRPESALALITRNWRPKLATVVGVSLLLFVLVGQKNDERGISIPVVYVNIPKDLTIEDNRVQEVHVRVRGSRMMLDYFLDPSQLQVSIDLNRASAGFKRYSISAKNIKLPVGLQIAGTNPAHIELNLRKKPGTPEGTG
ncbi:MAG: diadenylate cyclase [Candidatus Methylomirabilales bacterium]